MITWLNPNPPDPLPLLLPADLCTAPQGCRSHPEPPFLAGAGAGADFLVWLRLRLRLLLLLLLLLLLTGL